MLAVSAAAPRGRALAFSAYDGAIASPDPASGEGGEVIQLATEDY